MRESRPHTIDGFTYTIQQLGAKQGRIVLARVLRVVAGAAAAAQDQSDPLEAAGAAVGKLAESLTDAEIDYLCDTFAKTTLVGPEGTDKAVPLADKFDDHFAGRYGAMIKWLWAALETNYSSFLSDLGLDVGALVAGAKTAMVGTLQSQTPRSGASSSPASAG